MSTESAVSESAFDYDQVDLNTRIALQQHAGQIKQYAQDVAVDLWRMGELLADAQSRLAAHGTGTFQAWVEQETGIHLRAAYRLIAVHRAFDCDKLAQSPFATSALYVLARTSTPTQAREEAVYRAEQGEEITHAKAQQIVDAYRDRPEPPPPKQEEPPNGYREFERDELLPRLHDAGRPDSPQMVSGRTAPLERVSAERREQAGYGLREAIQDSFAQMRQVLLDRVRCCLQGCISVVNDGAYEEAWARLCAPDEDEQAQTDEQTGELLALFGQSVNSIAVASRIGAALARGPKTLADLTEIAIEVYDESVDGMDRDTYLHWRKRTIRWLDAITYVNGCPAYEHKLRNGQLCYSLLDAEDCVLSVGGVPTQPTT